jgi:molecular chaperone GrpE
MKRTSEKPEKVKPADDAETNVEQTEGERLKAENARLKEDLRREHDLYLRSVADLDNYRKRVERDRAQQAQAGKRGLILSLLDVMDDFERALAHAGQEPEPVVEGVQAIYRRLTALLAAEGVTAFESAGQPFDPALHEAVGSVESEGQQPGEVFDELSRGYRWKEELLRPARVRVAR